MFELGKDFNLSSRLLDVLSDTPLTVDMHIGEVPETSAAPESCNTDLAYILRPGSSAEAGRENLVIHVNNLLFTGLSRPQNFFG